MEYCGSPVLVFLLEKGAGRSEGLITEKNKQGIHGPGHCKVADFPRSVIVTLPCCTVLVLKSSSRDGGG
jgi:hypothetical protein